MAEERDIQFIFLSSRKGKIPFERVYHADTPLPSTQPSCPFSKVIHQTPPRGKYIFGKAVPISERSIQNMHCLLKRAVKSEFASEPTQQDLNAGEG